MSMEKISTDFFNYGTFQAQEADILKQELEKNGIPVKMFYPGTNIGRDATAGAEFTAYTLMIRACDFKAAEEVRENLGIQAVKKGESMPYFSRSFITWTRLIYGQIALFSLLILIFSYFDNQLGLTIVFLLFLTTIMITLGVYVFKTLRKLSRGKSLDEK